MRSAYATNTEVESRKLLFRLRVCLLVPTVPACSLGQSHSTKNSKATPTVSCSIHTETIQWSPKTPAIVNITIVSLSDTPLNIPLWSLLSFVPRSPDESLSIPLKSAGKIVAGVDPRAVRALEPFSSVVVTDQKPEQSLRLRFDHKHQKADVKVDARDLIWDYEVVSRSPTAKLFSLAKPGSYDAQFRMWWESGSCESSTVRLTILGDNQPQ